MIIEEIRKELRKMIKILKSMELKQWDYVESRRIGDNTTLAKNPLYARFVCPHTKEIKEVKIGEGDQ